MGRQQIWALKTKGVLSSFGGNDGYPDQLGRQYAYDDTVQNHEYPKAGDLIILLNKNEVLGVSKIDGITIDTGKHKNRYRCPVCNSSELSHRKTKLPPFRCRAKHEFETPVTEVVETIEYKMFYADSFRTLKSYMAPNEILPFYISHNSYYSIQQLAQTVFSLPSLKGLIESKSAYELNDKPINSTMEDDSDYQPDESDERRSKSVNQKIREGQKKFKDDLVKVHGMACMFTGTTVTHVIEAAHIMPYKGKKDNHWKNGLLIRSDLHRLFDLHLIGIDPHKHTIFVHPNLLNSEYEKLNAQKLKISRTNSPSQEGLTNRWELFKKKVQTAN